MSAVIDLPSEKQQAIDAIQRLPESATLDEMSEELAILAAIRRGEIAIAAGQFVSHDEVVRSSATWITK